MADDSFGGCRKTDEPTLRDWGNGWEEHRTRRLRRWARWSMGVRLDWLEEAQEVVDALFEGRWKLGLQVIPPRRFTGDEQ